MATDDVVIAIRADVAEFQTRIDAARKKIGKFKDELDKTDKVATKTTSSMEKNAAAAAASFLRITERILGRNSLLRLSYAGCVYLLSPGCWLLKARMLSSQPLRKFASTYVVLLRYAARALRSQPRSSALSSGSAVWAVGACSLLSICSIFYCLSCPLLVV